MILTKKISSLAGYIALLVVVAVFASIFFIAERAQVQADSLVDQAFGLNIE